jgi:hypothetical protein
MPICGKFLFGTSKIYFCLAVYNRQTNLYK